MNSLAFSSTPFWKQPLSFLASSAYHINATLLSWNMIFVFVFNECLLAQHISVRDSCLGSAHHAIWESL